jgi:hypothetical protein
VSSKTAVVTGLLDVVDGEGREGNAVADECGLERFGGGMFV